MACPVSLGAGLVDQEGEAVDIALADEKMPGIAGYDIKLACAHWQILVRQLGEQRLGQGLQLKLSSKHGGRPLVLLYYNGDIARVGWSTRR